MPSLPLRSSRVFLSALLLWFLFLALLVASVILIAPEIARNRYVYGCIGTVAAILAMAAVLKINNSPWVDLGLK